MLDQTYPGGGVVGRVTWWYPSPRNKPLVRIASLLSLHQPSDEGHALPPHPQDRMYPAQTERTFPVDANESITFPRITCMVGKCILAQLFY